MTNVSLDAHPTVAQQEVVVIPARDTIRVLPPTPTPSSQAEEHRLAALERFDLPGRSLQHQLEGIARLAQQITQTPYVLVNIIDRDHQVTACAVGAPARTIAREKSLCHHTVIKNDLLYLPDTLSDPRFRHHPAVAGDSGNSRMYAGAPLITDDGQALGVLCVVDTQPHELTPSQLEALRLLATQAVTVLELERHARLLTRTYTDLEDFASMVVRDVQHPLAQAIAEAELTADYVLVGSPLAGQALSNLHAMLQNSRQILEGVVTAAGTHHCPAQFAPYDLNVLAEQAVDAVQKSLPVNPTRVVITRLPTAEVDASLMLHVLHTLIINAMHNVDLTANPMVHISARESGKGCVIIIDDSGHGQTATPDGVRLSQGIEEPRLGLATCRRIAERHNGHLWFEDSHMGGVRVCLYLPTTQSPG